MTGSYSGEKLPSSRFKPSRDWHAVLPDNVALKMIRWERNQAMKRMFDLGFSPTQVGEYFGLGQNAVHNARYRVKPIVDKITGVLLHPIPCPLIDYFNTKPMMSTLLYLENVAYRKDITLIEKQEKFLKNQATLKNLEFLRKKEIR